RSDEQNLQVGPPEGGPHDRLVPLRATRYGGQPSRGTGAKVGGGGGSRIRNRGYRQLLDDVRLLIDVVATLRFRLLPGFHWCPLGSAQIDQISGGILEEAGTGLTSSRRCLARGRFPPPRKQAATRSPPSRTVIRSSPRPERVHSSVCDYSGFGKFSLRYFCTSARTAAPAPTAASVSNGVRTPLVESRC